jgi:hypothetical protein
MIARLPRAAVIDLDNCVSDDKWRMSLCQLHHEQPNDRYWEYHAACDRDIMANRDVVKRLAENHALLVFTSRPEVVRTKTVIWLERWRLPVARIWMRPNDNQDPSTILKRKMLEEAREWFNVVHAIDDRVDILNMYAEAGVQTCQRVFIHEPEIIHP